MRAWQGVIASRKSKTIKTIVNVASLIWSKVSSQYRKFVTNWLFWSLLTVVCYGASSTALGNATSDFNQHGAGPIISSGIANVAVSVLMIAFSVIAMAITRQFERPKSWKDLMERIVLAFSQSFILGILTAISKSVGVPVAIANSSTQTGSFFLIWSRLGKLGLVARVLAVSTVIIVPLLLMLPSAAVASLPLGPVLGLVAAGVFIVGALRARNSVLNTRLKESTSIYFIAFAMGIGSLILDGSSVLLGLALHLGKVPHVSGLSFIQLGIAASLIALALITDLKATHLGGKQRLVEINAIRSGTIIVAGLVDAAVFGSPLTLISVTCYLVLTYSLVTLTWVLSTGEK